MSVELGTVCYAGTHGGQVFLGRDFTADKSFSEETAAKIDREIKAIIDKAYIRAEELLRENIDKLHQIVAFLMKHEFMEADEFKALMDDNATLEQLEEMRADRERKVREQNERVAQEEARKQAEEKAQIESQEQPFGLGFVPPDSQNNE
jgi:cell division protease FtsH